MNNQFQKLTEKPYEASKEEADLSNKVLGDEAIRDQYLYAMVKRLENENAVRAQKIKDMEQDRDMRQHYADKIFNLICVYLFCVFLILFLSGYSTNGLCSSFTLSDKVLLLMLGTTTANLLGLLYVVIKYIFPQRLVK